MNDAIIFTCKSQVTRFLTRLIDKGVQPWANEAQRIFNNFYDNDEITILTYIAEATILYNKWRARRQ